MANIRIERLESTFQEELSMILMTEIKDEDIRFVTITGCDITSDLSFAKVYVTVLEEEKKKEILEKLNNAAAFIRGKLSERVEIRHTPELKFFYDESIAYGEKIEKIIDEIHEKENDQFFFSWSSYSIININGGKL